MTDAALPDDRYQTLELIGEAVADRLTAQRTAIERIETKGTILLGFTTAAAQLVIAAESLDRPLQLAAIVAYGVAFLAGVVVIAPFRHAYPPDPTRFLRHYHSRPRAEALRALVANRVKSFEKNRIVADRKARAWWTSLSALGAALILSAIGAR